MVICWLGILSILFNCSVSVRDVFLNVSSTANVGLVVDGGIVRKDIMSYADCLRKCSSLISWKGTVVEKCDYITVPYHFRSR